MININYGNCYSFIHNINPIQRRTIDNALKAKNENAWRSRAYQEGNWDGYKHFLTRKDTFPTGLIDLIKNVCLLNTWEYEIMNLPEDIVYTPDYNISIKLRDYQIEAINIALVRKRGILNCAVNAGKTAMALSIIKTINMPTLWLTHLRVLARQVIGEFKKIFPEDEIGYIGESIFNPKKYTVAIVNSLDIDSRKEEINKFLNTIKVLIGDEIQHSSSDSWYKIIMKTPAVYRYGLSGTPFKDNDIKDTKLVACTGNILYTVGQKELIKRGISAKPTIYIQKVPGKINPAFINPGDFYLETIVNNEIRNAIIRDKMLDCIKRNKSTMLYVDSVEHGKYFERWLMKKGRFIYGETKYKDRDKTIERFNNKNFPILIASRILKEGVNIPNIESLIIASAGKDTIQVIGRALRGGGTVEIYDFQDDFNKVCKKQSKKRIQKYKEEEFEIKYV